MGDYFKLELGKNRRVGFSLKQELKGLFQQDFLIDFTTCKLGVDLVGDCHSAGCGGANCHCEGLVVFVFGSYRNGHGNIPAYLLTLLILSYISFNLIVPASKRFRFF